MKGFALRLVFKQRHKITRKWPIITLELRHVKIYESPSANTVSLAQPRVITLLLIPMSCIAKLGNSNLKNHPVKVNIVKCEVPIGSFI